MTSKSFLDHTRRPLLIMVLCNLILWQTVNSFRMMSSPFRLSSILRMEGNDGANNEIDGPDYIEEGDANIGLTATISMEPTERKELWKSVSKMERRAVELLSSEPTENSMDEAIRQLANSISSKNNDPFIQLSIQYTAALERQDTTEAERLFSDMKQVGLPPHLVHLIDRSAELKIKEKEQQEELKKQQESGLASGSGILDPPEEIDPSSTFSDTVTEKVRVKINSFYDPVKSNPSEGRFAFWYKVTIFNEGPEPVQVVARMWEIEKCRGEKEVIRGSGVTGQQPILAPGDSFSYQSMCPLKVFPPKGKRLIGSMSGAFTLVKGNMGQHNFTVKASKVNFILPENAAAGPSDSYNAGLPTKKE